MAVPTASTVTKTRDRLKDSGSDKSVWVTSFGYQLKVLLQRQSRQSRGEVRRHRKKQDRKRAFLPIPGAVVSDHVLRKRRRLQYSCTEVQYALSTYTANQTRPNVL